MITLVKITGTAWVNPDHVIALGATYTVGDCDVILVELTSGRAIEISIPADADVESSLDKLVERITYAQTGTTDLNGDLR